MLCARFALILIGLTRLTDIAFDDHALDAFSHVRDRRTSIGLSVFIGATRHVVPLIQHRFSRVYGRNHGLGIHLKY